jgi:exodeoxyribonuclease-3
VAILTRRDTLPPPVDVVTALPAFEDAQKRVIAATCGPIRVVCAYFPNGQAVGSEKYEYKLRWIAALNRWLCEELVHYPQLALAGDFNVAPEDRDVHDPQAWAGKSCSRSRRNSVPQPARIGPVDSFRPFEQPDAATRGGTTGCIRRKMIAHRPCAAVETAGAAPHGLHDRCAAPAGSRAITLR